MIESLIFIIIFLALSLRYNWWRKTHSLNKARILMYHSISEHKINEKHNKWRVKPKDFDKQMKWFYDNGWSSYTISELTSLNIIPEKSFVVTFDDGFEDNYINAFPILKKYNFKATIYLVPLQNENHWEKDNTSYLSKLLDENQIKDMLSSNLIEFGSHTLSHKNLLKIQKLEDLEKEIFFSKQKVEELTKTECKAFAYPYGKFDNRIIDIVKKAGYKNATVVKRGLFDKTDDVFAINRLGILGTESFIDFLLKIFKVRNKL